MLRLYPIRYRQLRTECRFNRFDLVELNIERPDKDYRPESRHVVEDSIRIISRGADLKEEAKVALWKRFVVPSLKDLLAENKTTKRSFGIVKPDVGSLRFFSRAVKDLGEDAQALSRSAFQTASMFEAALPKLAPPNYAFGYKFTSNGNSHEYLIHDWEVQAAYINFQNRYGEGVLDKLTEQYGEIIPKHNLHFILGTMKARPTQFIIIGLLRSKFGPDDLNRQATMFG